MYRGGGAGAEEGVSGCQFDFTAGCRNAQTEKQRKAQQPEGGHGGEHRGKESRTPHCMARCQDNSSACWLLALTCMHMQGPSHFSEGRRAAIRCELFPRGSPRTRTRNQSTAESVAETLAGCTGHTNGRDTITEEHFLGQACISEPRSGSRIFYGSHNRFPSQTECNLKLHQSFPWPSNPLSSCSELSIALQQNPAPHPAALRRPKVLTSSHTYSTESLTAMATQTSPPRTTGSQVDVLLHHSTLDWQYHPGSEVNVTGDFITAHGGQIHHGLGGRSQLDVETRRYGPFRPYLYGRPREPVTSGKQQANCSFTSTPTETLKPLSGSTYPTS